MQTIINSKNSITFSSVDENGEFILKIVKPAPKPGFRKFQIQLHSGVDESYIDISRGGLTAIRDMINTVLEETKDG